MKNKKNKKEDDKPGMHPEKFENFEYPNSEDIYTKDERVEDVDLDDGHKLKKEPPVDEKSKGTKPDMTGEDLDVPGAELDDEAEDNGEEDEENNYYSLGGDKHDD